MNVKIYKDFTDDSEETALNYHGNFMTSLIGSQNPECLGISPDAEIYAFKVFNWNSESYTEWFLNAFNFAIENEVDIINLSLGSSDFEDEPFIRKI